MSATTDLAVRIIGVLIDAALLLFAGAMLADAFGFPPSKGVQAMAAVGLARFAFAPWGWQRRS